MDLKLNFLPFDVAGLTGKPANRGATLTWWDAPYGNYIWAYWLFENIDHAEISWMPGSGSSNVPKNMDIQTFIQSGLDNGTLYTFTVKVVNKDGYRSAGVSVEVRPDTLPEVVLFNAQAADQKVNLSWLEPAATSYAGVHLFCSKAGIACGDEKIPKGSDGNHSFTALTNGVQYTFTAKAYDSSDNESSGVVKNSSPGTNCVDYGGTIGWMCDVPTGEFWMGCNTAVNTDCQSWSIPHDYSSSPFHKVNLSAFKIDKYEITAQEYKNCVDVGLCTPAATGGACTYNVSGKENNPANCVDWIQADTYCQWAGKRLPTEAEWEKAARGETGLNYPWGDGPTPDCNYVVMNDSNFNSVGCGTSGTMPVGNKPAGASPYGAEDMIGNVWEWVSDSYEYYYYSWSVQSDPLGPPSTYGEPAKTRPHSRRGGSYRDSDIRFLRVSERDWDFGWSIQYIPTWTVNTGFRCAK